MSTAGHATRRLISVDEVGGKLGLHRRSVYRLADEGVIPYGVKVGGARRWDEHAIDAWIAQGCPRTRKGAR
jgi:excisionase family DNA binding protein